MLNKFDAWFRRINQLTAWCKKIQACLNLPPSSYHQPRAAGGQPIGPDRTCVTELSLIFFCSTLYARDTALGGKPRWRGVTINYFRIACSFYGFEIRPARPEMWGNFLVRRICISIAITFWPATSCSVVLTPQKWTRMRNYVVAQNHAKQHLVSTILSMTVKPSILDWIHDSLESWSLARGVWPSNDGDYIYQEEALHLFFDLPERAGAGFSTLKLF